MRVISFSVHVDISTVKLGSLIFTKGKPSSIGPYKNAISSRSESISRLSLLLSRVEIMRGLVGILSCWAEVIFIRSFVSIGNGFLCSSASSIRQLPRKLSTYILHPSILAATTRQEHSGGKHPQKPQTMQYLLSFHSVWFRVLWCLR